MVYQGYNNMDVFILCGGFGRRLKKILRGVPKPMLKVGNYRFLDIILTHMADFGFKRFILGTGYKAGVIKDYYRYRHRGVVSILFSDEKTPLGTGGAVKKAKRVIKSNPFFVLNGDSFCKFNPTDVINFHKQKKALITIVLKKISNGKEYGKVTIDKSFRILKFSEKDKTAAGCLINAGVYIFDKNIFDLMPYVSKFSLEYDLFPRMIGKRIFGYPYTGLFIDIGTHQRYQLANNIFKEAITKQ